MTNAARPSLIDLRITVPACGAPSRFTGQTYIFHGLVPYVRVDGSLTQQGIWQTDCAICSKSFTQKTGLTPKWFNKRCLDCRCAPTQTLHPENEQAKTGR